jgi:anti-anti-sigma regulatory factor
MSPSSKAADRPVRDSGPCAAQSASPPASSIVTLPERVDFTAARDLHARLVELRGSAVEVDGSAVSFGGALGAQVLLTAALDWAATGDALHLTISTALRDDLLRLDVLGKFPTVIEVV